MKKVTFLIILIFATVAANAQFNAPPSLFSDVKARNIDDAVTIMIVEDTRAQNSAGTTMDRSDNLSGGLGASGSTGGGLSGSLNGALNVNSGSQFQSNAGNTRNESFRTTLSARVIDVEQNGNLIIQGRRTMKINGEEQSVTIEGVIRPVDILPNNSVYSFNIMNMQLTIEGDGNITEVQEPGLITKFIRALF